VNKKFVITGNNKLSGEYKVQGSKNAALPIISAALLSQTSVRLRNVPRIIDVQNLLEIVASVGVSVTWEDDSLLLDTTGLGSGELSGELVKKLRGSLLLLGSLAPLLGSVRCGLPGGCPIGRRSFDSHWKVFRSSGFSVVEEAGGIEVKKTASVAEPTVYLEESSVTATENALLLFSALGGGTVENPAREPHVLALIRFLTELGCDIELHPLYYRVRKGSHPQKDLIDFRIPADYIDAGTVAMAAAVTGGDVSMSGASYGDIIGFRGVLEGFGVKLDEEGSDHLVVRTLKDRVSPSQLTAGLWPSFPTDLVSLAIVLATQSQGLCLVHDWLYESRMFFIDKLVRMGAHVTMCDPHRVLVEGPTQLRGTHLESPDIRAGMALVVAGLCAEGVTVLEHAEVIERGYERVTARLNSIGAEISEETVS
jgi:UDP-N-acetylglucosamine 1-carboxyvinyltransferase